jgi:hypothetical protein
MPSTGPSHQSLTHTMVTGRSSSQSSPRSGRGAATQPSTGPGASRHPRPAGLKRVRMIHTRSADDSTTTDRNPPPKPDGTTQRPSHDRPAPAIAKHVATPGGIREQAGPRLHAGGRRRHGERGRRTEALAVMRQVFCRARMSRNRGLGQGCRRGGGSPRRATAVSRPDAGSAAIQAYV